MDSDTIVAIATAPGRGAVALVRLSGPRALEIGGALAPGLNPDDDRRAQLTSVVDPEDATTLDRALVTVFRGPNSYTGEDVVEISTHGGALVPALVLDAAVALGARLAEPGEFTRRAYLNGRLNLVQAEAVLDLVEGGSRRLHRAAIVNLDAGLTERLTGFREALIRLEALLVHHLDFPDEDDAPVPLPRIVEAARGLEADLTLLVRTAPEGELLRSGARVVLAGRPNAGKSSLFNALVGRERAIVTPSPGTTRDAIEIGITCDGYPFQLVDTAGLRESSDEIERLGVEVTRREVEEADLVLLCVEAGRELTPEEERFLKEGGGVPVVCVRTKADLVDAPVQGGLSVSSTTGHGLDAVRARLVAAVFSGLAGGAGTAGILTRPRQTREARRALDEVTAFRNALEGGVPAEVAATHLRAAETALEDLLGVVDSDEILDRVFREFCIGK